MASLVVRAGTGPGVGAGHLARCLALVQAWVDGGDEAAIVGDGMPAVWAARYEAEGAVLLPDGSPLAADWLVLDGYGFEPDVHRQATEAGCLLVIDDHGQVDSRAADLVLDHNPGARASSYGDRRSGADVLLGSRYALLRRELREGLRPRVTPDRVGTLLVALGGAPSTAVSASVRAAVDATKLDWRVEWLTGSDDVVAPMQEADLAVSGAGVTASELSAFGVPAVLVVLADNQRPVGEALAAAGVARLAGSIETMDPATITAALVDLAGDVEARRAMVDRGQRLVDGRGALRVAARLRSDLLHLRPASQADARRLWEWVNDPVVRSTSFSTDPVPWDTHVAWLDRQLADGDVHLSIVESASGAALGQVRLDIQGAVAEISIGLDPAQRGRGLGPAAIDAAVRQLFAESAVETVEARIRPDNEASRRAFGDACFEALGEGSDGGMTWLRYARSR